MRFISFELFSPEGQDAYQRFCSKFTEQITLWQSDLWARVQGYHGEDEPPRLCLLVEDDDILLGAICYKRTLPKNLHWVYMSRGPLWSEQTTYEIFHRFVTSVSTVFSGTCVWVRFDPPVEKGEEPFQLKKYYRRAHKEFHPRSTIYLDIDLDESSLLEQMKPKGRYNIRLSQRKGVEAIILSHRGGGWQCVGGKEALMMEDPLEIYYHLSKETTARDGFHGAEKGYYQHVMEVLGENAYIVLAQYNGEWISGAICILYGDKAYYYYGASSNSYRNVMAPYLVQWEAMGYAKQKGAHTYDLLGVASKELGDKDPLWGVTGFKEKFGGIHYTTIGTWEYVSNTWWYHAIKLTKWLRHFKP